MGVDYRPIMGEYTELKPFRFWCQKVLPLVYDDSLSYYELLCKVVDYLNKTMEDVDTLHSDVTNLNQSYVELQDFVNEYFDNLDVQQEIDNKLDEMAESGILSDLLEPFVPDLVSEWLSQHITPTTPAIDNTLTVSGAGADAKVTGDKINSLTNTVYTATGNKEIEMTTGSYYQLDNPSINIGYPTQHATEKCALVPCNAGDVFTISGTGGPSAKPWGFVDSNGTVINTKGNNTYVTIVDEVVVAPPNSAYLVLNNQTTDNGKSYYGRLLINEVSDIANYISVADNVDLIRTINWQRGTIGENGEEGNYANRVRTDYIKITDFTKIDFSIKSGYKYCYHIYDANKTWIAYSGWDTWKTTPVTYAIPDNVYYLRIVLANTANTDVGIEINRNAKALANKKINVDLNELNNNYDTFKNLTQDTELGSWAIGWVYATGNIGFASDFYQYVCTHAVQRLPYSIDIMPNNGFQYIVRIYNDDETAVIRSTEWLTTKYHIPSDTPFAINISKVALETVQDIDEYISSLNVRSSALNNIVSPCIRKKTKIAILGDSISSFNGYSESGYYTPYYPTGDVQNVWQMWWYIVAEALNAIDNISVSAISRSAYYDFGEQDYPPVYNSNRIARLGDGGDPDVILINTGTNDGFATQNSDIAYTTDVTELNALPNSTSKGIALTIRKLQTAYPNAKIVVMIPKQVKFADMPTGYDVERVCKISDEIKAYSEMYGVWKVIDLRKCGINQNNIGSFCVDGNTHPNAKGMREIANYILDELR